MSNANSETQETQSPPTAPVNNASPGGRNRRGGNYYNSPEFRTLSRELRSQRARSQDSKKYRTYLVLGIVLLMLAFDNSYIFETSFVASVRLFLFTFIGVLLVLYFCSFLQRRNDWRGNTFYYHQAHLQQFLNSQYPGLINARHLQLELMDRDFNENDYEMLLALDEDVPNKPVSAEVVAQLPDQPVTSASQPLHQQSCSICLEKYEIGDVTKSMPCLHAFHSLCLNKWLLHKPTCPICKFNLNY